MILPINPSLLWLKGMLLSAKVFPELCFFTRSAPSIRFLWLLLSPTLVAWNEIHLFSYNSGVQKAGVFFHWAEIKMWAGCAPSWGCRRTSLLSVPASGGSWHFLAGGHFDLYAQSHVAFLSVCLVLKSPPAFLLKGYMWLHLGSTWITKDISFPSQNS